MGLTMFDDDLILIREPKTRPAKTVFENSDRNRQQQLFSRGLGELPGQMLLIDPLACGPEETTECEH